MNSCHVSGLTATILIVAWTMSTPIAAQEANLPTGPITVQLEQGSNLYRAKYGSRSVWVQLLVTDSFEMRATLGMLLGEPLQKYEVRTPRLGSLTFEADAGYANHVTIGSIGDNYGETHVSASWGDGAYEVNVSQDVLDRIGYDDFTFSLETHTLDELPDQFYTGVGDPRRVATGQVGVHIHSPITGVLPERPGAWGWDVPAVPAGTSCCHRPICLWGQTNGSCPTTDSCPPTTPAKRSAACSIGTTWRRRSCSSPTRSTSATCA